MSTRCLHTPQSAPPSFCGHSEKSLHLTGSCRPVTEVAVLDGTAEVVTTLVVGAVVVTVGAMVVTTTLDVSIEAGAWSSAPCRDSEVAAPGGWVAKPLQAVVVHDTSRGQSGMGTHTVGQGVVVVVDVVMEVRVVAVVEVQVVSVPVTSVRDVSVPVVIDVVVKVVNEVPVVVVVVSVTTGPAERKPQISDRNTTAQRSQGQHHIHQDLCAGTLTTSYWPPVPTYLYSVTGWNCPLPPPTYARISPSLLSQHCCAQPSCWYAPPPHQLEKLSQYCRYGE
mmetsp:Transcript_37767/g.98499  ORF Transcript_37767/g.98499 Transcript_37767/m.98499 type:complete len:279 (+) Transcript_37767:1547-2383(+)